MVKIGYKSKEQIMQAIVSQKFFILIATNHTSFALIHPIDCAQILVYHII
jgi:hypothetical protein